MKTKKIILSFMIFTSIATSNVFANYPVIDLSNLMNGIDQLYSTYEMINNTITQVQNTYKQIEQSIAMVKGFDWSNVGSAAFDWGSAWGELDGMNAWELLTEKDKVLATKKRLTDLTGSVSDSINVYTNVLKKLDQETVTINGQQFSTLGLFGVGSHGDGNAISAVLNSAGALAKEELKFAEAFEEMTPEERRWQERRWGISGGGAMSLALADTVLTSNQDKLLSLASEQGQQMKRSMRAASKAAVKAMEDLAHADGSLEEMSQAQILTTQLMNEEINSSLADLTNAANAREMREYIKRKQEDLQKQQEIKIETNEGTASVNTGAAQNAAGVVQ